MERVSFEENLFT